MTKKIYTLPNIQSPRVKSFWKIQKKRAKIISIAIVISLIAIVIILKSMQVI